MVNPGDALELEVAFVELTKLGVTLEIKLVKLTDTFKILVISSWNW